MKKIWEIVELSRRDWWKLARMFYNAAHRDFRELDELPDHLIDHQAAELCRQYRETGNSDLLDQAGYLLTRSKQWYVYLGRIM